MASALYCPFLHLRHDADADEGDGSDADDDDDDSHKCYRTKKYVCPLSIVCCLLSVLLHHIFFVKSFYITFRSVLPTFLCNSIIVGTKGGLGRLMGGGGE